MLQHIPGRRLENTACPNSDGDSPENLSDNQEIAQRVDGSALPSLSHSEVFTNLFSSGYVCVSVSNVLDKSFPAEENPRFENVFFCNTLNSARSSFRYFNVYKWT